MILSLVKVNMEHNKKKAWTSYVYIQELTKVRPLARGEESLLNTYEQTGWMCAMCDSTRDTEHGMKNHFAYQRPICQDTWTRKRNLFLHEIKGFRPLNTEENEWLRKFGQTFHCEICDEEVETKDKSNLRQYGVGAQILSDLGVKNMTLLSNSKKKAIGLKGFNLSIVDWEKLD